MYYPLGDRTVLWIVWISHHKHKTGNCWSTWFTLVNNSDMQYASIYKRFLSLSWRIYATIISFSRIWMKVNVLSKMLTTTKRRFVCHIKEMTMINMYMTINIQSCSFDMVKQPVSELRFVSMRMFHHISFISFHIDFTWPRWNQDGWQDTESSLDQDWHSSLVRVAWYNLYPMTAALYSLYHDYSTPLHRVLGDWSFTRDKDKPVLRNISHLIIEKSQLRNVEECAVYLVSNLCDVWYQRWMGTKRNAINIIPSHTHVTTISYSHNHFKKFNK